MHPVKRRKLEISSATSQKLFQSPLQATSQLSGTADRKSLSRSMDETKLTTKPASTVLQREYTNLSRQLTSLRQSLDTVQQALVIETNDQDNQVEALSKKWKQVVQDAADDLFESSKDIALLHQQASEEPREPDMPFWKQEQLERLTEEERDLMEAQWEDSRRQAEKYGMLEAPETAETTGTSFSSVSRVFFVPPKNPLIHQAAISHYGSYVAADEHRSQSCRIR